MVRFVRDTMHGFSERPHYEPRELDSMFEKIVCDFLRKKHDKVEFPIDTEDLKTIIEADVRDLDQFADLSKYGPNAEGVTEFFRDSKPKVLISTFAHKHENPAEDDPHARVCAGHVRRRHQMYPETPDARGRRRASIYAQCLILRRF